MSTEESPEHLDDGHWAVVNGVRKWVENPPAPLSRDQLLKNAAASPKKSTRQLGERIKAQLDRLARDLVDEKRAEEEKAAKAAADRVRRARIAELESELRKLKGKPTGPGKRGPYNLERGEFPCDDCGRVFDTKQGHRLHQRRAHEGYGPRAAHQDGAA